MICTWRDHRPIIGVCSLCAGAVQTTAQQRGRIYCPGCREKRRKESARAANERFRAKARYSKLAEEHGGNPFRLRPFSDHTLAAYESGSNQDSQEARL